MGRGKYSTLDAGIGTIYKSSGKRISLAEYNDMLDAYENMKGPIKKKKVKKKKVKRKKK